MNGPHLSATDLELFVIGGLSPEGTAELETHVRACASCSARLQREARLDLALSDVALAARKPEAPVRAPVRRWRRHAFAAASASAVAVIFAAIGVSPGGPFSQTAPVPMAMQPAIAAARDLPAGATLTKGDFAPVSVSQALALRHAAAADRADEWLGRKLTVPLSKGELLLTSFTAPGREGSIGGYVQKKTRAAGFTVEGADSVVGGDHVDVISQIRDPQTHELVSLTTLQNVIVVEDPVPHGDDDETVLRDVTLLLLPEEVEALGEAARLGKLSISLRNREDIDVSEDRGRATMRTLLSMERPRILERRRKEIAPHLTHGEAPTTANRPDSASVHPASFDGVPFLSVRAGVGPK